jgi:hypothetical protein
VEPVPIAQPPEELPPEDDLDANPGGTADTAAAVNANAAANTDIAAAVPGISEPDPAAAIPVRHSKLEW